MMKMPGTPTKEDPTISCYFTLARPLAKLKRLLTTIQQTANNVSPQVSESVQVLILHLVNNLVTPDQFQNDVQNLIKCPLKQFVVPFIISTLPLLQDEIYQNCDKSAPSSQQAAAKIIPKTEPLTSSSTTPVPDTRATPAKRGSSSSPEVSSPFKRPCYSDMRYRAVIRRALQISQCLTLLGKELECELRSLDDEKLPELDEPEFTKELNILSSLLSALSGEQSTVILEQVKDLIKRRTQDTVNKTYSMLNKQDDDKVNSCWNCGRKALESCSGCSIAKYCGLFCQHKHWQIHHTVCKSGSGSATSQYPDVLKRAAEPEPAEPDLSVTD